MAVETKARIRDRDGNYVEVPALDDTGKVPTDLLPAAAGVDQAAIDASVNAAVAALVAGAPAALNTLKELADAIGDDASYAASITAALATKQPLDADLTAIAALATTAFGRSVLTTADAAALRAAINAVTATDHLPSATDAFFATLGGSGYATFGLYPTSCRLGASGTTPITFNVLAGDTFDIYAFGLGSCVPSGCGTYGKADGGGTVEYANLAADHPGFVALSPGVVTLTFTDSNSTHGNGSGGASCCVSKITLRRPATPAVTYSDLPDIAAPANPGAGAHRLYSKANGLFYRDSAGVEVGPLGSGGGLVGSSFPPLYDHAARIRPILYGSGAYGNATAPTDWDDSTAANATTAAMPQDAEMDLGDNPPGIGSARIVYNDAGHRSATGSLDWSDDDAAWTQAVTWAGDATTERWHTFAPVAHRYWRIHTTAPGSGGSGIDIKTISLFPAGKDVARGIVPTSNSGFNTIANATDGNFATKAAGTDGGNGKWVRVDLGSAQAIIGCHAYFADLAHTITNGVFEYSLDDATWVPVKAWGWTWNIEQFADLRAAPITARYWRLRAINVNGGNGIELLQLEFATAA